MLALTCRFVTAAPRTTATIRPGGQKTKRWRVLLTAWLVNARGHGLQESSLVLCIAWLLPFRLLLLPWSPLPPLKARPLALPLLSPLSPSPLCLPLPLPLHLPLLLPTLSPTSGPSPPTLVLSGCSGVVRRRTVQKSPSRATTITSASPTALGPTSPVAVRQQEQTVRGDDDDDEEEGGEGGQSSRL